MLKHGVKWRLKGENAILCDLKYQETYGFLRQLKEFIVYMRRGDGTWGTDDLYDKSASTLYALSVLNLLDGSIDNKFLESSISMVETVKQRISADREMLIPYVLGLYLFYVNVPRERPIVTLEIEELLKKAEMEFTLSEDTSERLSYSVEYIFAVSMFLSLIYASDIENVSDQIATRFDGVSTKIASKFQGLDDKSKTKLLFALSVRQALHEDLRGIYRSYKNDIENLRNRIREEDLLALIVKPYMIIGVECNRTVVFRLIDYFQKESQYGIQEREIRYRLSRALIYMGDPSKTGIEIRAIDDSRYQIQIEVTEDTLNTLQRQAPSVQFVSRIALWLGLAGFRYTYVVPEGEREAYREFVKERWTDKYIRVNKRGLQEILSRTVSMTSRFNMLGASNLFILGAMLSFSISYLSRVPLLEGTIIGSLIWLMLTEAIGHQLPAYFYVALFSTIGRRNKNNKRLREELDRLLEVS